MTAIQAAVAGQISLTVAVEVEPRTMTRPGVEFFQMPVWTILPRQVISRGKTDVDRHKALLAMLLQLSAETSET